MTKQHAGILATLITISATFPLIAKAGDMISPVHYGDELERCITAVRDFLGQSGEAKIRHHVTGIQKHGAWYEFELLSQPYQAGEPGVVALSSHCRANRFSAATVLVSKGQVAGSVTAGR